MSAGNAGAPELGAGGGSAPPPNNAAGPAPTEGTNAAPSASATPTGPSFPRIGASFNEVFPKSDDRAAHGKLVALQKRLESAPAPKSNAPLNSPAALAKLLPPKLAGLPSPGPTKGPTMAGDKPLSVSAQLYKQGAREVYVKITDTLQAPFMRDPVLKRLSQVDSAANGYLHGIIAAGYPAILQYYPQQHSSQLSALVGNRYVVDVRILNASSVDEAQTVFESLPLSQLARP